MKNTNYVNMCRAKIHRATVTEADLDYEGSITIDEALIEAAGLFDYEQVHVLNLSTGSRVETYVIRGTRNSGTICLNGAAARLGSKGDTVIIIAYAFVPQENASKFRPKIVLVDADNKITDVK
jgi:aspartate 1-decarboxylase